MTRKFINILGAITVVAAAQVSTAGIVAPELTIDANLGGVMQQITPTGVAGVGGFQYERDFNTDPLSTNVDAGTIDIGWSWIANEPASRGFGGPVSLIGGLTVANNTDSTQTISLLTTLPLINAITPASVIGGSIAASVTAGPGGATLSTSGSTAFYQGMIDGAVVGLNAADLLPAPSMVTVGSFNSGSLGPASFGNPIPSQPAGAINASIGIWITFDLTPGDVMSFTSSFVADIPAPGSAGLLAIAGLFITRRRRH